MGIVETIEAGKIVQENRIDRLRCAPEGYNKKFWREELKEKNRENIFTFIKSLYPSALYIRKCTDKGMFSFLRVEGMDLVVDVDNEQVPIWDIKTIERLLAHWKKRREERLRGKRK